MNFIDKGMAKRMNWLYIAAKKQQNIVAAHLRLFSNQKKERRIDVHKIDNALLQLYSKDNTCFTYYTATDTVTIYAGQDGVTEEWIQMIKELHRIERNSIRKEERNTRFDAISELVGDKSLILASVEQLSIEDSYIQQETNLHLKNQLIKAFSLLTVKQKQLFYAVRVQKQSIVSIARQEGVHESSVRERLKRIESKLKKELGHVRDSNQ